MRAIALVLGVSAVLFIALAVSPRVVLAGAGGWVRDAGTGCAVWADEAGPDIRMTWSGACPGGKASGEGTLQWYRGDRSTDRFAGTYLDGRRHSWGIWWAANGDRYEGEWQYDQASGQGTIEFADGGRYDGELLAFRFNGQGVWLGANGDRYEGTFANGEFHGQGILSYADGGGYKGEFLAGQFQGMGELRIASGEVFVGPFVQSRPHGVGRCGTANGEGGPCEFLDGGFLNWVE